MQRKRRACQICTRVFLTSTTTATALSPHHCGARESQTVAMDGRYVDALPDHVCVPEVFSDEQATQ